ncbi:MAG: FAD-dependent oxidoreductase [Planctomycetota bacterium]
MNASQSQYDVIVIGGSAAGITAAITARRHNHDASILLVRREEQVLIPCGIPYIFGTVESAQNNLIPDAVLEKNDVDLILDDVRDIDTEGHVIRTAGDEQITYRRLILATGGKPVQLPLPGADLENVFSIRKSVPYLENMLSVLQSTEDLVIVGGGFIGVEFADECRKRWDMNVSIVELLSYPLQLAFDEEFCIRAQTLLKERDVNVITGARVEEFVGEDSVCAVRLDDNREIDADAVIQSVGVQTNASLAQQSGLEIGPTGGIHVDRAMRTSEPHVFACGDCAEKVSFFTGEPTALRLASIATTEARVAGANLFGITRSYPGAVGVYSTIIGDTAFGTAGLTEHAADEAGYSFVTGKASSMNRHPGKMPGGANLTLKLIFERQTRILIGGQVMGARSGGEQINTISACIQQKMTADEIATFQTGTHPALTASPIAYQLVNAAENAISAMDAT